MVVAEHVAARRTAESSAAAARLPSPFPRRSRRLSLSGGRSGALAPRRLDSDGELPLTPSSLFRPPHGASAHGRHLPPRLRGGVETDVRSWSR